MNFRFTLNHSIEGNYVLSKTPVGWENTELAVKRSDTFKGLFFDFTTKLKFFCGGGGKEYIDNIYDTYGVEADVSVLVEIDCTDSGTFDTLFEGTINFSSYEKTQTAPEYTIVNIENAGIEQTIAKRYETTINLNKLLTIDGTVITPFTFEAYELNLHSKVIVYAGSFARLEPVTDAAGFTDGGELHSPINSDAYITPPFGQILYDDIGLLLPTEEGYYGSNRDPTLDPIFQNTNGVSTVYTVNFKHTGAFRCSSMNATADSFTLKLYYKKGTDFITAVDTLIHDFGAQSTPGSDILATIPIALDLAAFNITLAADEYLWIYYSANGFVIDSNNPTNFNAYFVLLTDGYLKISEESTTSASSCKAFPVFEVGARLAQSITNQTDAFRSDFLGRTNAEPYATEENGCGSFTAITNGYQIRGFPIEDSGTTPNIVIGRPIYDSLKNYFESLSVIYNLGLGLESEGDNHYIRIEPIEYFFSTDVLFQIPNIKNYKVRNADEFYINNIEVGYDKWESEEVNGLDEFNTKREYSIKLKKNGNKITKLSRYVGSPNALELTRRKQYSSFPTTDTSYDQENFIICLKRTVNYADVPTHLSTAEKDENFTDISNLISPSTIYNLRISPGRIIRNWFKTIGASIIKMNDTLKEVKFAFGQGNYKMVSTCTDSCDSALESEVNEGSDLNIELPAIDDSLEPIFENEFIIFEHPLSYTQYNLIKANPTKCLEISPYSGNFIKAFIFDVRYNPVTGMAKFILLKAYQPETDCTHIYVEAGYVECGYVE